MLKRLCILVLMLAPCVSGGVVSAVQPQERIKPQKQTSDSVTISRREMQTLEHEERIREHLSSQERRADSMADAELKERNARFYDSLHVKSRHRSFARMLYDLLVVSPSTDHESKIVDESEAIEPFEGRPIERITIKCGNIYDPDEATTRLRRMVNGVHVVTHEAVIRRDLMFKAGDRVDAELIVRNKQLLRSRSYISDVDIDVIPIDGGQDAVEIVVRTRDSWTITADAALNSDYRTMVALYDANIFGTGTMLKLKTNFSRRDFSYGGTMVEYEMPNVLGTFFTGRFEAGRDFYNSTLDIGLKKEFLKSTDYEAGASYTSLKHKRYMVHQDTSLLLKERNLDIWGGYSLYRPSIASSVYLTTHFNSRRYDFRPEVSENYNPALHERDILLFGGGLYREKFLTANMIYGFGQSEYIAEGYKAEIIGGYSWGEFGNDFYLGVEYAQGAFVKWGYLSGGLRAGSHINAASGRWHHAVTDINLSWFSNLVPVRCNHMRQFLELHYTRGWRRSEGSDESIRFTDEDGLEVMREHHLGISRMVLNSETVVFTRFEPFGFRIALFGFVDLGLLGYNVNPFRNSFYSSLGFGVRLRNERLIFSTIQLQLGIAFGKGGYADSRWFDLSNGTRMAENRYIPTRPEVVPFE